MEDDWGGYVSNRLGNLIAQGKGQPNRKEKMAEDKKIGKAKSTRKKTMGK